jgi:hypothetical protein
LTDNTIKVGMLAAYDWNLLKSSIPRIYNEADLIVIALDKERRSWAGNKFNIPDHFFQWIKSIDEEHKIEIYEDNFFVSRLSPMENDTRERNLLARFLGDGGWHIQIDSDEYFLDFGAFVKKLKNLDTEGPITICCRWLPLIKKINDGYLLVDFKDKNYETFPVATNCPVYVSARRNEAPAIFFDDLVVHETWARSDDELKTKLNNWGHRDDLNVESYYNLWFALDEHNCRYISDFHPLEPQLWPSLKFVRGQDIDCCLANIMEDLNNELAGENDVDSEIRKVGKKSIISRIAANINNLFMKNRRMIS